MSQQTSVDYIIFPKFDPSAEPEIKALTSAEALNGLIQVSRNLPQFGNTGLHTLANVVKEAKCFTLKSNKLNSSVALVDQLINN